MNLFSSLNIFLEAVGKIGIAINAGIYHCISYVYQIFLLLAETNLFSEGEYQRLVSKIYIVLGVVVLFIMAYNMLTYIVDPDKDKTFTASGKLVKNIVVSFIMIAVCPYVFSFAFGLQNAVLNGGVIHNFFADSSNTDGGTINVRNGGRVMAKQTFFTFFTGDLEQKNMTKGKIYTDKNVYKCKGLSEGECFQKFGVSKKNTELGGCSYGNDRITCSYELDCTGTNNCTLQQANDYVHATGSFAPLNAFAQNLWEDKIEYDWFLALLAGLYLGYVIINFCFDMAIRIAKLTFYQIIAPLTIATRMLPSQDKIFKNWFDAVKNTFFMVFIRVFVLALGIYLIDQFETNFVHVFWGDITNISTGAAGVKMFATLFTILGIMTFVKEAPKLVQEVFGIKDIKLGLRENFKNAITPPEVALKFGAMAGSMIKSSVNAASRKRDSKAELTKLKKSGKISEEEYKKRMRMVNRANAGSALGGFIQGVKQADNAKDYKSMFEAISKGAQKQGEKADEKLAYEATHGGTIKGVLTGKLDDFKKSIKMWAEGTDTATLERRSALLGSYTSKMSQNKSDAESVLTSEMAKGTGSKFNQDKLASDIGALIVKARDTTLDASEREAAKQEAKEKLKFRREMQAITDGKGHDLFDLSKAHTDAQHALEELQLAVQTGRKIKDSITGEEREVTQADIDNAQQTIKDTLKAFTDTLQSASLSDDFLANKTAIFMDLMKSVGVSGTEAITAAMKVAGTDAAITGSTLEKLENLRKGNGSMDDFKNLGQAMKDTASAEKAEIDKTIATRKKDEAAKGGDKK